MDERMRKLHQLTNDSLTTTSDTLHGVDDLRQEVRDCVTRQDKLWTTMTSLESKMDLILQCMAGNTPQKSLQVLTQDGEVHLIGEPKAPKHASLQQRPSPEEAASIHAELQASEATSDTSEEEWNSSNEDTTD